MSFFTHLTPEKSIVIHQDFYHPTAFYLPVVMDFLSDHFTIIEAGRDWSVVFRLEKAIPPRETGNRQPLQILLRPTTRRLLRRMMRRVGMPGRDYLRLSECALIGTTFGEARFRAALGAAIRRVESLKPIGYGWTDSPGAATLRRRGFAPGFMERRL